ncbi:MAG: hypothetical protein SF123_21235 [Chloroflexota bacterium]|nr:hypothetical protein [Chloroflexota bacterium]
MNTTETAPIPVQTDSKAETVFGSALLFSGIRCVLQYAILPFALPLIGVAADVATPISLAINLVAIIALGYSVRRMWQINYKHKWLYTGIGAVSLIIMISFILLDIGILKP